MPPLESSAYADRSGHARWPEVAFALGIGLAAISLRMVRLGSLSLAGDEETTTLAALALLEGWPPTLPGGLIYLRGLPFTFLEAAVIAVAGWSETAVRLVPVLLAGPRVVAAWWMARPLVGPALAVSVAALLSVAPADVEISRAARMYSMFVTLDVLMIAALVHTAAGSGRAGLAGIAGVLSVWTHRLAMTHVPVPLAAALGSRLSAATRAALLGVTAAMVGSYLLLARLLAWGHHGLGEAVRGAASPAGSPTAAGTPALAHLARLEEALAGWGWVFALLAALGALALAQRGVRSLPGRAGRIAAGCAVGSCVAAAPVLAVPLLLAVPGLARLPLASALRQGRGVLAGCAVGCAGWGLAAIAAAGGSGGLESAARLLLGLPAPNWYEFVLAAPGLSALGVVGLGVAASRAGTATHSGPWLVLMAATLGPALVGGLGARAEPLRYHATAIAPLILTALVGAHALTSRGLGGRRARVFAAVLVTAVALRPDQAIRAVLRDHGPTSEPFAGQIAPDHRGAAAFVRSRASGEDWIAAEDALQQHLQVGRTEIWLRRLEDASAFLHTDARGEVRDIYVGARHAHDLDAVSELARRHGETIVWLVTSGEVEVAPHWYRTPETQRVLESWQPLAWFLGRDGATRVYRLEGGVPVPPPASPRGVPESRSFR